ncbi:hypothetical protein [Clostridium sp.]|uniref:DUF6897 domain-containing protein n=1 Tax=Clostridium sp. TaxID=1506 RepID=UPI002FC8DFFB
MCEFIRDNYKGATITLAITGLPILITGEVLSTREDRVIGLRLKDGTKIYINAELIAFIF